MIRYMFVILAICLLLLSGCLAQPNTDVIDGGVHHFEDEHAPKTIQSTEITYFYCKFSSMDRSMEETSVAGQIFTLTATKDSYTCELRNRDNETTVETFATGADFLVQLQDIVSRYEMAQENGLHHTVSGLPPDFGIDLEVQYASGETIRTSNNQHCFLSNAAMEELVALFQHK